MTAATELAAADAAYTAAVQAAVSGHGDWASVQVAGDVVRQARAALKATTPPTILARGPWLWPDDRTGMEWATEHDERL
jgi:hypothetical protein